MKTKQKKSYQITDLQEALKDHGYKNKIYIVRINELPGICTDAKTLDEAMESIKEPMTAAIEFYMENHENIPEPIKEEDFKGNIAYRTTSRRHCFLSKEAQKREQSLSQVIDSLVDTLLARKRPL